MGGCGDDVDHVVCGFASVDGLVGFCGSLLGFIDALGLRDMLEEKSIMDLDLWGLRDNER